MRIVSIKYVFCLTEAQVSEKSSTAIAIETKPLTYGFTHINTNIYSLHMSISPPGAPGTPFTRWSAK